MLFREVENKGIDCRLFGYLLESEETNGCHDLIDLYFVSVGEGVVELEIPISKRHLNVQGTVHGGIIANLIDSAMGMAIKSLDKVGATTGLSVNFLKSAGRGDVLKAVGTVTKNGKNVIFGEAKVYNQKGDLLAQGQGSFYCVGDFLKKYLLTKQNQ